MKPIRTPKTTGVYGAPPGHEGEVGGLPFYREKVTLGATVTTEVVSVWTFSQMDRDFIARGANLVIGILGREPIPPISVSLRDGPAFSEIDPPTADGLPAERTSFVIVRIVDLDELMRRIGAQR